jgi:hypothetical protein
MDVSRDRGPAFEGLDWEAAWDGIVAGLRPRRYARLARSAIRTLLAVAVMASTLWMLMALVVEPFTQLGRPWL